jgi:CRP/FNR family cyclic AMP-dependent transcriptional regulator
MPDPAELINFLSKRKLRVIPELLLQKYHGRLSNVSKDQVLFDIGDTANNFYQVESGQVKMFVVGLDGQEFTQGVFGPGESFGEPALLGKFEYPAAAKVTEKGKIWRLPADEFFTLLRENFNVHLKLDEVLCKRLQYKSMILTEVSTHGPEHRIMTLLKYFKSKVSKNKSEPVMIPFTRQQLADMAGLRVETVIRTVKKLEKSGHLVLEGHKIRF